MSALSTSHVAGACDEHELVAAVRRGDDRAFGELYERYGRRIVSYVFGMVGDHGRAEDITQEVFISALRRMRDTERPIAFKPWIYEIARNACIDEFRRVRRTREVPLATDDDDPESADRRLVSRTHAPEVSLERRQQLDDLRGAFRGLSNNHHKLIVMRELEGLSYDEIGKRMGMTRPMVESTLFRARRRLSEEYQDIASGRRCDQVHTVIDGGAKAIQSLGIKERRRLARHVSYCQPCRRFALAEGFDDSALQAPGLAGKIAALLPIPAFLRWRRGGGGGGTDAESATNAGSHSFSALQTVQSVVQFVDPASPAVGFGRAAAAVAAIIVAGGGVVGGIAATSGGSKPQPAKQIIHVTSAGASSAGAADQRRVGATPAGGVNGGAPKVRVSRDAAAGSAGSGASGSSSTSTASSGIFSPSGNTTADLASTVAGGIGQRDSGRGSSGSSVPSKLPLPSVPKLPTVKVPALPQLDLPTVNIPQTVQNAIGGAGKAAGGVVNGLKGVL
jgi:RNA polymerase sigma factor (sigma-70 family)